MCLYLRELPNPKYKKNKKNGGNIPPVRDERTLYVPITCGNCIECRKQKAREWQIRLLEDIKTNKNAKMITFTFSNESILKLKNQEPTKNWKSLKHLTGYKLDNELATRAVRLFQERWRKKYKEQLRHWYVTELGHNGTENIHLHGIIWTNKTPQEIQERWQYGHIWPKDTWKGNYVNNQTVNYLSKYVHKQDEIHTYYKAIILTSPGIGKDYINSYNVKRNKYNNNQTDETYRTDTGHKIALPKYWKQKIYTDDERERLWTMKLDKQIRWICGEKIDISKNTNNYEKLLEHYRTINTELGYMSNQIDEERYKQENDMRNKQQTIRIAKAKNNNNN